MTGLLAFTALCVLCVLALALIRANRWINNVLARYDAMTERELQEELERLQ